MTEQCDPESARSLLRNPLLQGKIVMIGLDVTHSALASEGIQQRVLHGDIGKGFQSPHPMRRMFYELLTFFSGTYREVFGFMDGPPLHDPLAVAVVLDMLGIEELGFEDGNVDGLNGERWDVDVDIGGSEPHGQVGRVLLLDQLDDGIGGGVRVPRRVRYLHRFWNLIESALQKAQVESDKTGVWDRKEV